MKYTSKTILFSLLILSLGLVLSACNKEDMRIKEQENIKAQLQEQKNQEVISDEVINEDKDNEDKDNNSDLDIAQWREYENKYFNVRFKYHNFWYFQRDNLNQGDYIAVYGFAPSVSDLNAKNYAIKLYILNKEDNLNENFSFQKEKQGENKKYILTSNDEKYINILNLMFENLEIVSKKNNILEKN